MIYGFSPHSPAATDALRAQVLPCRRKGCGCIPYDHSKHSKKAREAREAAAVVRGDGLEPPTARV